MGIMENKITTTFRELMPKGGRSIVLEYSILEGDASVTCFHGPYS